MEKNLNKDFQVKITQGFWNAYNLVNPRDLGDNGGSSFEVQATVVKINGNFKIFDINNKEIFNASENAEVFVRAFEETERILGCKMFV